MGSLMVLMLEISFCDGGCALRLRYFSKQKSWWQPCCDVAFRSVVVVNSRKDRK